MTMLGTMGMGLAAFSYILYMNSINGTTLNPLFRLTQPTHKY